MSALWVSFLVYLGLVLAIGVWSALRTSSQSEYLLGGQKLPAWAIAISERASGESAWLLLGLTGAALSVGLAESWTVIGSVGGVLFIWLFVGARLRGLMEHTDALTLPELLAQRATEFEPSRTKNAHTIRAVASLIIMVFFTFYVAAQMAGAGKVFVQTGLLSEGAMPFGASAEQIGVLIGALVVVGYTLLGGFGAVVWTDLLQGVIMILALLVLPVVALMRLQESDTSLGEALAAAGPKQASWVAGASGAAAVLTVLNGLSWGLGYMGQPHLMVRFMAMPSVEGIERNKVLASSWTLLAYGGAFGVGFMALMLYGAGHFDDPETLMPYMATQLLPGWIAGIVIAGVMAAMMSTADSQLLVVTSAASEDLVRRVFGIELSDRQQVWLSRIVVLTLGSFACLFAWSSEDLVYELVSFSWSGLGSSFGPVILLLAIRGHLPGRAILGGMLTGSLVTVAWKSASTAYGLQASERLVAWVAAFLVVYLLSLDANKAAESKGVVS